MEPPRWQQIEWLYHEALEKSPGERASFLQQACAADPSLRQEVESLLAVADDADGYLKAAVAGATMQIPMENARLPKHDLAAGRTLGRYQLLEELGRGGMGVVYRAVDPSIGRIVAIKTILFANAAEEQRSDLRARLLRESQAGGQLSHPNIVGVFDVSEQGETAYIVMEYVVGQTLDQAIPANGSLRSSEETLRIVRECADALDYAWGRGIVHRDIKPSNIILQPGGGVKIADFGIARVAQSAPLTQSTDLVGSPHYMAPEQWKGGAVTGQTDQYALAVVAYGMLTGHLPFEGATMAALAAKALYEEPVAATAYNAALNPAVDEVFRRALAKIAANRYESCSAFASALRLACQKPLDAAPAVSSRPPRPKSNWLAAVVVAGVLSALGGGAWLYQRNSAAQLEIAYWTSIKDSKTREPFTAYLQRYPEGQFAGLAKSQLEAMNNVRPAEINPQPSGKAPKRPARVETAKTKASLPESTPHPVTSPQPPPDSDPYSEGNALLKRGEYAAALPYFTKAIAARPEYRSYFGRAGAYQNLEQIDRAIEDYTQAIRLNPASGMAYHDRAVCLAHIRENDRALADYNRALELAPDNPLTWNGRGVIYARRKEYAKAVSDFTEAIRLRPTFAQPYQNRAAARKALGDVTGANADLNQAKGLKQQ